MGDDVKDSQGAEKIRCRRTSPVTDALAMSALIMAAPWAALAIMEHEGIALVLPFTAGQMWAMPWTGAALASLACATEAVSRLRKPPARWRVVQELEQSIVKVKLLKDSREQFQRCFKAGKLARYDRKSRVLRLWFDLRVPDAERKLARCAMPTAFRHAQRVEITPHENKRGERNGFDLRIWYGSEKDTYDRALDDAKPW